MANKILQSPRVEKMHALADKFYHSWFYLCLITAIGAWGFIASQEIIAIYIIITFAFAGLALCKDITPFFIAIMIVGLAPLARYNQEDYFRPLFYAPIIVVLAIIGRIILSRTKLKKGFFFVPTVVVAISVTVGGLFFLTPKQYFSMPAMYYVIGLGAAMVLVYAFFEGAVEKDSTREQIDFFAKIMVCAGAMGVIMIATYYIRHYPLIEENFSRFNSYFQWGNNLSNNLLITMPFTFYLSSRSRRPLFLFVLAILQYFALVLSLSRGGMIFSIIGLVGGVAFTLYYAKGHRAKLAIAFAVLFGGFIALLIPHYDTINRQLHISSGESRALMYKLAVQLFKEHPIFGTGLAYNPKMYYFPKPMCIYWYHSTLFQIIGSLGLVGIIAYSLQFIYRAKSILATKSRFNAFAMLSFLGFAAYSMVNVGYFTPLPFVVVLSMLFIMIDRNNRLVSRDKFAD